MNETETPRTNENACWPSINEDSDKYSKDGIYVDSDFARQLERELNEAIKQRDEAKSEIERLKNAITKFYRDFDCISWGYDGNCGTGLLADDLFESLEKPTEGGAF